MMRILLAIFIAFSSLSAMMEEEKHSCNNVCLGHIYNGINGNILGIRENIRLKTIRTFIANFSSCLSCNGDKALVVDGLINVENEIPEECKNAYVFHCLQNDHLYTGFLMSLLVADQVNRFEEVNGFTIDQFRNNRARSMHESLSSEMQEFIYDQAKRDYEEKIQISRLMRNIPFQTAEDDIHYMTLKSVPADKESLIYISSPASYIRMAIAGKDIFWSLQNSKPDKTITKVDDEEKCFAHSFADIYSYLIVFKKGYLQNIRPIIDTLYEKRGYNGIVVFQRPTFESFLCQQALKASRDKVDELIALKKFVTKNDQIKGFVKKNALKRIDSRLLLLNQ